MGATINSAVSRVSHRKWAAHVAGYVLGLFAGAAVAVLVISLLAQAVDQATRLSAWLVIAVVVISAAIAYDLGIRVPLPYRDVQVPDNLRYIAPPGAVALLYGLHLGTGFLTRYTYSTHTAFMLAFPLALRPDVIPVAIVAFAVGKSLIVIAAAGTSVDAEGRSALHRRFIWRPGGLRALRLMNAAVATAIVITAVHTGGGVL